MHFVPFLVAVVVSAVSAQFFSTYSTSIEFGRTRPLEGVTWSSSINLTSAGLSTEPVQSSNNSRDFWIQLQPLAAGMSWRPPRSTQVKVTLTDLELDNGHIQLFFRYSSDRVHWSSWYAMRSTPTAGRGASAEYQGAASLPQAAGEQYAALMSDWWRTAPEWSSDEHEFCMWLAAHHPNYFATEMPFIGYVQVRFEGNARQLRLAGVMVEQSWGVSGLSAIPTKEQRASANDKWFFDLAKFVRKQEK